MFGLWWVCRLAEMSEILGTYKCALSQVSPWDNSCPFLLSQGLLELFTSVVFDSFGVT